MNGEKEQTEIKARITDIRIGLQNNNTFDTFPSNEFSEALEWIKYYWDTKNFLPSFGDSISDDIGKCYIVTGKAFFINDYERVEIYVMDEDEFSFRVFKTDDFTFKLEEPNIKQNVLNLKKLAHQVQNNDNNEDNEKN